MELSSLPLNRLFSQAEANAMVPGLQISFAAISEMKLSVEEGLRDLTDGAPERVAGILDGHLPPPAGAEERVEELQASLRDLAEAIEEIASQGVIIQEVDPGVVDFPSLVDGKLVLLCWQFGESAVEHFHGIEASFDERAPLPDTSPLLH